MQKLIIFIVIFVFSITLFTYAKEVGVIKLKVGGQFVITLDSNPTTGYKWQLDCPINKDKVELIESRYIPSSSRSVGAGGRQEWVFKACGHGKAVICFKYVRPWEENVAAIKKKRFVIIIEK
jgi:inhibitor of cysteine peptidase